MKSGPGSRSRWLTALFKGLALVVPWGVIEVALRDLHHPEFGYYLGLWLGVIAMYAVPPRDISLWRFLLFGAVISALHPLTRLYIPWVQL